MRDKEHDLLHRQIRGLNEDNDRIAKMYKLVQNVSQGKPVVVDQEVAAPCQVYDQKKLQDKAEQNARKGWKTANDESRAGPAGMLSGNDSLANTMHF